MPRKGKDDWRLSTRRLEQAIDFSCQAGAGFAFLANLLAIGPVLLLQCLTVQPNTKPGCAAEYAVEHAVSEFLLNMSCLPELGTMVFVAAWRNRFCGFGTPSAEIDDFNLHTSLSILLGTVDNFGLPLLERSQQIRASHHQ